MTAVDRHSARRIAERVLSSRQATSDEYDLAHSVMWLLDVERAEARHAAAERFADQAVSIAAKKSLYETAFVNLTMWQRILHQHGVYQAALVEISHMPTSERNPDGDEQAAFSMRVAAQDALEAGALTPPEGRVRPGGDPDGAALSTKQDA